MVILRERGSWGRITRGIPSGVLRGAWGNRYRKGVRKDYHGNPPRAGQRWADYHGNPCMLGAFAWITIGIRGMARSALSSEEHLKACVVGHSKEIISRWVIDS